jgi:hypothetical protein
MTTNDEERRRWKEAVMAYFAIFSFFLKDLKSHEKDS